MQLTRKIIISLTLLIIISVVVIDVAAQSVQPKGKLVLQPFAYGNVQLLDSKWKDQVQETMEYYLRVPNDDLLKGFRKRAHLPTYGAADLGGWYSHEYWSPFGQIISGLSRFYAATGDIRCKIKADALIKGWGECIDTSGYFFFTDTPNAQHYIYEKTVCGLVDAYTYTGNKDALRYLDVITNWAIKHLSRNLTWAGEWYTLPENLYKAWQITGDRKYFDFASEWLYDRFWNGIRNDSDIYKIQPSFHAYSHLNTFSSAAAAYLATGDNAYKQTIEKAYDFFNTEQCYPSGGFGPNEAIQPDIYRVSAAKATHSSFETQCGSWAIFKLCKYLITITGDARYGDWIEKALINGIGASIPMSSDGRVMYYSDYNPREGFKRNTTDPWTCCTGTRPQAVADYANLIYFTSQGTLDVNLFVPSRVQYNGLTLIQQTNFPASGTVMFTIKTASKDNKTVLHIRKPGWLKEPAAILINGKPFQATVSNNWYEVVRTWKDGDEIKLELPMSFSFEKVSQHQLYPVELMHGPVAMAVRCGTDNYPVSLLRNAKPWETFSLVDGQPETYHTTLDSSLLIRPFYDFEENENYIMLLDSSVKQYIPIHNIDTTGWWRAWYQICGEPGGTITAKFYGTGFKITGGYSDNAGMFSLSIDGKWIANYDQYKKEGGPFVAEVKDLPLGEHVAVITTLQETNKESKGRFVNYGTLEKID